MNRDVEPTVRQYHSERTAQEIKYQMDDVCVENVSREAINASDHDSGQKSISDMYG